MLNFDSLSTRQLSHQANLTAKETLATGRLDFLKATKNYIRFPVLRVYIMSYLKN